MPKKKTLTLSEKRSIANRSRTTHSGGTGGARKGAGRKPSCVCGECAKCKRRKRDAGSK